MLWSKSIERKIVLVMDNIEQLLEDSDMKSELTGLILNLRKNSQRYLQILTTTRVKFTIHEKSTIQYHEIVEFDEESSVELLKKCCPAEDMTDACLSDVANLCGYVPLALCIAGTLMPDLNHPSKLIQWLREKPLEALENSDQCVRQAIEFSFHKLSDEDQKAFVCLSVFDGDFQSNSAEEIIVRNYIETIRFLNNLVSRSLLQRTMDKRFVIHSLIRRFLADHSEFKDVRATAQRLMIRHFLKMCHSLTIKCYSHNKFESTRELLKKDIHNIEETLKICTQVQDHTTISKANISELIASSDVYKSSYLFFHNFSWDLLPEKILKSFFECCINLAGGRNEPAIQILFQCLAAAQEGRDSAWKSTEYTNRIKTITTEFRKNKAALKEDRLAFMFCCHLLGKYYLNKETKCLPPDLAKDDYLSFSPESEVKRSPIEKAANAYILMMHGLLCKMRAKKEFRGNEQKSKEFMDQAELSYNQALSLARNYLGDHEFTCTLYRHFGDLFFDRRNDKALTYYTDAINLHKKLKLDCNEKFVMLLKNSAGCLSFSGRLDESVERLQEARDIANKITEEKTRFKAQVCCDLAINCSFLKPYRQKAAKYAKEAMEMKAFLDSRKEEKIRTIIVCAEEVQSSIRSLQDIIAVRETDRQSLKSCIPEIPQIYISRDHVVTQIISSLVEKGCGIVSIFGGSGFGKSTVAVEVSQYLSSEREIVVIFSFLSNASTVSDMIRRICHDVGVYPGDDAQSSLMLTLKNINRKVVLVMDDIEQLMEKNLESLSQCIELILGSSSQQHLQIMTTSRTKFVVPGKNTKSHRIEGFDERLSVKLLRRCCRNLTVVDAYLSELAELCGFVPFALCIAGTLIEDLDELSELIQWLREKPMEALRNSGKYVQQTILVSFQKLSHEDKKALVCLAVFGGNFETDSAKEVIKRSWLQTENLLARFGRRSLLQKTSKRRFVIHSLIRRFLVDYNQFQYERTVAQGLMVSHFLKLCDSLTKDCCSFNGFTTARESLKKDIHNIEETLRICTKDQATSLNAEILQFLTSSNVYKSPSLFFYNFSLDLLSESVLWKFFESCFRLAESRKQPAIEITFQCLLAYQEGLKSAWKSSEYNDRLELISAAFCTNKAVLKKDRFFFMFCYYFSARYISKKATNPLAPDLTEDDIPPLPDYKKTSKEEKATEAHFLIEVGNIYKKRANRVFGEDEEKYNEYLNCEKSYYKQALSLAEEFFGDHEITCIVCKLLGDFYFSLNKYTEALTYYSDAGRLRTKLGLDANESFALLLKNCGACLSHLGFFNESVETLKKAHDIAYKLTDKETCCRARVNNVLARTYHEWKPDCQEAAAYAKEAIKMRESLDLNMVETLENIIHRQGNDTR